ncbi:MAG: YggS family pyridoxal phosphate-dependent enzyme [Proteobacteria bacterium]|nr:YggS family pyridoxal phosphate-dependent enzyme [Pseudomonadota bacterium]
MNTLATQWQAVKSRILEAETNASRPEGSVKLLVASKTQSPAKIRSLYALGQKAFGENYVQEAIPKIQALSDLDIEWHFIGPIQGNKTTLIARHFSWVHGLCRLNIAERLNNMASQGCPLNVLIQVNPDLEPSKQGLPPEETLAFAQAISTLPNLALRGLMAIPREPEPGKTPDFSIIESLYQTLARKGFKFDTLSLGMSNDLEAAIKAGSTCVRIGTALFGPRPSNKNKGTV